MNSRLLTLLLAVVVTSTITASCSVKYAGAAVREPMRIGDSGPRVKDLQYRYLGHNAFRIRVRTSKPTGYFGRGTRAQTRTMKWRAGFPTSHVNGLAGKDFRLMLAGRVKRPPMYLQRAKQRRLVLLAEQALAREHTMATRIIAVARSQVGVTESPFGSNCGRQIRVYQALTHGTYCAAWCASFVQWTLMQSGYGTIANRSAGVAYIADWSRRAGFSITSKPSPGRLAYRYGQHISIVTSVTSAGYTTIGGNESNRVSVRFYRHGSGYSTFIQLPGARW